MNVCENLKTIRKLSGFTQIELAKRIGTNERSIRYFEDGLTNFSKKSPTSKRSESGG